MTQFSNHVSLPEDTKAKLIETLNTALATTNDLHSQVKQAHWNIKGPQFFARSNLYTEILRGTELDMWFLESHLNV